MEDRIPRTARRGRTVLPGRGLADAVHTPARAEHLQPAGRSVRTWSGKPAVCGLFHASGLLAGTGAGVRCEVVGDLQGIPDPAEARELQSRRGDAEAVGIAELSRWGRASNPHW